MRRKGAAENADGAGRRHHDQRRHIAGQNRLVEMRRNFCQKPLLGLLVPIDLLHGAAPVAGRAEGPARSIGAEFVVGWVGLLEHLPRGQVRMHAGPCVFQHQSLGAVADDDPSTFVDFQFGHENLRCGNLSRGARQALTQINA